VYFRVSQFYVGSGFAMKRVGDLPDVGWVYSKGMGKLSLCLTKNHAMKTYWGVEV
jgi:hypothetical protein